MTSCQLSPVIGSNATTSPQQVVRKLHLFDLLWTCCGFVVDFVVQHVVQQIHNKSNKWSLEVSVACSYVQHNESRVAELGLQAD